MKFKGKPITNASKLPPCMFSDIYNEKNDEKNDKLGGKRRRKSRKGGSGRGKKNVSFKNTDDIYSILSGKVVPSKVVRLDNRLPPNYISPASLMELGRSPEIQSSDSNKPRSPYTKKSNLKNKGGKTRKSNKSKRKTHSKRQRGGGVGCSRPGTCNGDRANVEEDLKIAIQSETPEHVKEYLDKGANPNIEVLDLNLHLPQDVRERLEPEQVPAIIYAARHIKPSTILKYLLDKGAVLEPGWDTTLLIEAAEYGNLSAVGYLLSIGADINATTGSGVPAIAYAVLNEDIPMIKLMLDERKGKIDFNYNVFDTENENVIDEAQENSANTEVAKILTKYAIEQRLPIHSERQKKRLELGHVMDKKRMPADLTHKILTEHFGGKRKTIKTRSKRQRGGKRRTKKNKKN
jgi:hypothetical protein